MSKIDEYLEGWNKVIIMSNLDNHFANRHILEDEFSIVPSFILLETQTDIYECIIYSPYLRNGRLPELALDLTDRRLGILGQAVYVPFNGRILAPQPTLASIREPNDPVTGRSMFANKDKSRSYIGLPDQFIVLAGTRATIRQGADADLRNTW